MSNITIGFLIIFISLGFAYFGALGVKRGMEEMKYSDNSSQPQFVQYEVDPNWCEKNGHEYRQYDNAVDMNIIELPYCVTCGKERNRHE